MASEKYIRTKYKVPFVGDKFAAYEDGDTIIELTANHMDYHTTLFYSTKSAMVTFDATVEKEKKKARQSE